MDHSSHIRLTLAEQTEENLTGAPIYDQNDEKVGTISHLHDVGVAPKVVIDVGGFLGIGAKPVLINLDDLDLMRDTAGRVHGLTTWSKDQLRALPEHYD
ncbi:PRC-barrel domain-containing protein [Pseudotabrizicola algicola]|uniref:PRC-barrel domain containing protein n=1 Tax=Pseudotabrizicola algicola TaxID=2709381 RepID=A0A6B3RMT4_9RHOB|nr:PRC-barrel domain-containing protein [Pseudotabrizicola algicola]NEX46493.1 PRC-barrel domain containing protein [Pseudotabrizicola algicola]